MIIRFIRLLTIVFLLPVIAFAKGFGEKGENAVLAKIKKDVDSICSEKMEGRLTGSDGEILAANYIESRFILMGLSPYKGRYKSEFTSTGGMRLGKNAYFKIFDKNLILNNDILFLPFGEGNKMSGFAYPEVYEQNNVWFVSLKKMNSFEKINPQKSMYLFAKLALEQQATGVVFLNDIDASMDLSPVNLSKFEPLTIPVAFMSNKAYNNFIKPNLKKDWIDFDAKLGYEESKSTGKNVMGFIDNHAPLTIVIGAHFDHVGVFAGADNNASGVAGLLQLAENIKSSKINEYNYLFVAFSGKEQNLQGSKAFIKQNETLLNSFSCMINLDMIGNLNPKNKNIYLNGIMTSNLWLNAINTVNTSAFKLNVDSSGYGFSDYTSFYQKNIPVLNVSTGYSHNYLTAEDKTNKVSHNSILEISNFVFRLVSELSLQTKPTFSKTYDVLPDLQKLKIDLGIIPDFTFNENGIRIDACIPSKLANKAGLQGGDVITKIGELKIIDFDDYMQAIKSASIEKETTFVVKRDGVEFKFFILVKD